MLPTAISAKDFITIMLLLKLAFSVSATLAQISHLNHENSPTDSTTSLLSIAKYCY